MTTPKRQRRIMSMVVFVVLCLSCTSTPAAFDTPTPRLGVKVQTQIAWKTPTAIRPTPTRIPLVTPTPISVLGAVEVPSKSPTPHDLVTGLGISAREAMGLLDSFTFKYDSLVKTRFEEVPAI